MELVGATMKYSVETHRARLKATEEGLVVPEGMSGKAVGFIYRLVGPEVTHVFVLLRPRLMFRRRFVAACDDLSHCYSLLLLLLS